MMQVLFNPSYGRSWLHFLLRWFLLVGFALAVFVARLPFPLQLPTSWEPFSDIALAVGIGVVVNILLAAIAAVPFLRDYAIFVILPGDWIIAGVFGYLSAGNPLLLLGIALLTSTAGVLRLGYSEGWLHVLGTFIAVGVATVYHPNVGMLFVRQNPQPYMAAGTFLVALLIITSLWTYFSRQANSNEWKELKAEIAEKTARLTKIQESAQSFSEMAASLNSTLNYDQILETALNIGRLALRLDQRQRAVAIALMVEDEEGLEVAASRGMTHNDMKHRFQGSLESIIGRVMENGDVEMLDGADNDPELRPLVSFKDIESVLCIPLRAEYTSYGVLLFGSSVPKAINADNIGILKSIGVQVTVALKNSVLYNSLREEKRRMIEIEESARKALVRDLHDVPTQTMSAVAMQLSVLPMVAQRQPEKLKEEVEDIRQRALRAVEEIRHVMFSLRPLSLETQGLGEALRQLAEKMGKTYKQPMTVECDPNAESLLDQEQRGTLFYLVEEAANNARKHAQANMIKATVTHEDTNVVVRVMDNGKGFDVDSTDKNYEKRGSFGMVNMRERAGLINGTYDLQSAPGKGTVITVKVPVGVKASPKRNGDLKRSTNSDLRRTTSERRQIKAERTGPLSPSR